MTSSQWTEHKEVTKDDLQMKGKDQQRLFAHAHIVKKTEGFNIIHCDI